MNLESRKIDLISWITSLNSEDLINKMEELKQHSNTIPKEILDLLDESSKNKEFTIHTSAKDLIE